MKTFVSSKNIFSCAILWIIALGLLIIIFIEKPEAEAPPIYIFNTIMIGIISMIIWILLDTKYNIIEEILYYYSGPFRGKININSIRKIERHSGLIVPVTYKPALDTKGLIIHYNSFDDIYISPKKQEIFIQELLKINPNIKVVN
ncbi:MAG: hypothetical protein EBR38_02720 [Flavobacteriaceae bacterium]|nr:hypothetical protein [Flavobacteriaceae bacterium]